MSVLTFVTGIFEPVARFVDDLHTSAEEKRKAVSEVIQSDRYPFRDRCERLKSYMNGRGDRRRRLAPEVSVDEHRVKRSRTTATWPCPRFCARVVGSRRRTTRPGNTTSPG